MQYLSIVLTAFLFSATCQGAILSVGDGLRLHAIDGQIITKKYRFSVDIKTGKRQLVISYDKTLSKNNRPLTNSYRSSHRRSNVTSSPYIFFVDINQDTQIGVQRFSTAFQARSAIQRGLVFIVKNKQDSNLIDNADELQGNGMSPFSSANLKPLIDTYNQAHGINFE
jgi:hypothetical protein